MFTIILIALLACACLYIGIIIGVKDCKQQFGIPKGVTNMEEWQNYCNTDCEKSINE